jgi:hypothetical protein
MTETPKVRALAWQTPFGLADADRLHLLRVDYPSTDWVGYVDGRSFDFSAYSGPPTCQIWLFNEEDETVYLVSADADTVQIHDERDLPRIDEFEEGAKTNTVRLTGTELHRSVSSAMNGDKPSYLIITGNDCVEFLCLNPPRVDAVEKLSASKSN